MTCTRIALSASVPTIHAKSFVVVLNAFAGDALRRLTAASRVTI